MIYNMARSGARALDRVLECANLMAAAMMVVMVAIVVYEVICRYIFNAPTIWTLDLSIYLLIWLGYLAIAYVEKQDRHVRVDLLIVNFPPRTRAIWEVLSSSIFFLFMCTLTYFGFLFALESFHLKEENWSMWTVLAWPTKAALPVGGALASIYLLRKIVSKVMALRKDDLWRGTGLYSRPEIIVPAFIALIALSLYLYTVNGVAGMVLMVLLLLFGGIPIFPSLGIVGVLGYYLVFGGLAGVASFFPTIAYESLNNFALACLPLFILAGAMMQTGGISEEIFDVVSKWVGHLPAGEAIATILACGIFAAISTSSVATAVTIGLIALPALAARKYDKRFSYGLLAAGGTLGLMIPPSGSMIIYSVVTEESLGKLFLAGALPGVLMLTLFIGYSMWFCARSKSYERKPPAPWAEKVKAMKVGIWGLLAPVIILGGIYSGVFTPLESGAVAAAYAMIMVVARRKVPLKDLPKIIGQSTLSSVMVMSIIIGALTLGDFMTLTKLPDDAMRFVSGLGYPPWAVLIMILLMYFVLGMFLEVVSCMMITLPIVYPLIISLGFDGIWFAVIVTLMMEMACIPPPVGLNLFVIKGITHADLSDVLRGVAPFFIMMFIGLIILILLPQLSTWLPGVLVTK